MIFGKYAAIAGGVAIAAVWPFATGQIGQSLYEEEIKQVQSPYVKVENESYHRGYLSSEVATKVSLTGAMKDFYETEGLPTSYTILSHVNHGFLGVSTTSTLEMTPEVKVFTDLLWESGESPFTVVAETSIFGDTQYDITMRAMNGQDEELKVTSSPANIAGTADKDGNIIYQMEMPALEVVGVDGETLSFKDITGSGQGKLVDETWVGKQLINIASASLQDVTGIAATVTNLSADIENGLVSTTGGDVASAKPEELRMNNRNIISFQKLDVPETMALDNFKMGVNFLNLDYASMMVLANTSNTMSDEPTDEEMMQLASAIDGLVEKGLSFELMPLEVSTVEGQINAKLDLNLEPGLGSVTQNIGALMSKLKGNLYVNVPTAYVQGIPELAASLNNLEPYGFISEGNNGTTLEAKIEGDKAISPSGEEIPIGLLMMMFM